MPKKFIVIYGANNLGKTIQAKKLVEKLVEAGRKAIYLKFPIYNLAPTGPLLNKILRGNGEKPGYEEIQRIFAQNRKDYQAELIKIIESGIIPVCEDYKGTGIAWGMTFDVTLQKLEEMNAELIDPQVSICLDGERFIEGIEKGHLHEDSGLWDKNRKIHQQLARKYGWKRVLANQSIEKVAEDIWNIASKLLI